MCAHDYQKHPSRAPSLAKPFARARPQIKTDDKNEINGRQTKENIADKIGILIRCLTPFDQIWSFLAHLALSV